MRSAVVLGGYGNFGKRVVAALAADRACRVVVAGRDFQQARAVADSVGFPAEPVALDMRATNLAAELRWLDAGIVVHAAGPFQGQDYAVARACIEARAHCVDLADARGYVCGIGVLDEAARGGDVLVVSGASSVPALSSAVVDMLGREFSQIESIEHGITSGAKPPGLAAMEGVLGYVGKPIKQWRGGQWRTAYGWQDLVRRRYPYPIGARWLGNCDVPDLELFPQRYAPVQKVTFRAGVATAASMLTTWGASWLVRAGLMTSLVRYVPRLHRIALAVERFGSKCSGMHVTLQGLDAKSQPISRTWWLVAGNNHGPQVPCFPAIALARKLLRGEVRARGAMPCVGLLSIDEILAVGRDLDLRAEVSRD
jgi:hypothetical protein